MRRPALLLASLLLFAGPAPAAFNAQTVTQAHTDISRIIASAELSHSDSHYELHRRHPEDEPQDSRWHLPAWLRWLHIPHGIRYLPWIVLGVLIGLLLWHWRRWAHLLPPLTLGSRAVPPLHIQHRPLREEIPLPADIAAAAEAQWAAGERRAALSLLYRGALEHLHTRATLSPSVSATEHENLTRVRASQAAPVVEDFSLIVRAWLRAAYADQYPAQPTALLEAYRRQFRPEPRHDV